MYVILGNGFDLNLGLKTSYADFLNSAEFEGITNNSLKDHLIEANDIQGWVDVEAELKEYAEGYYQDEEMKIVDGLLDEYLELKNNLSTYLGKCSDNLNYQDDNFSVKFLQYIFSGNNAFHKPTIFNFNYTDSVEKYIRPPQYKQLIYMHGTLKNDDINFGIGDRTENLERGHTFLKKSHAMNYSSSFNNFFGRDQRSGDIVQVYIFGHSLGESDNDYFKNFFRSPWLDRITLTLINKGEKGKQQMLANIDEIVDGEMAQFRNTIEKFNYIDTEKGWDENIWG